MNRHELIIDNFAGGGGASQGIEDATGRPVDIAINHDKMAVAMHMVNHPKTQHYCEDVFAVDPRKVTNGQPVGLVWLSPDCKHFSKAKGGKPVEKKIRGLAWVALRWAATVQPRVIILENVEEFKTWGPLLKNGQPDPKQKGRTFNCFVNALRRQGYVVETRELRACDFGAPTTRKRLFLIARRDGRRIEWPEPTHGDTMSAAVKSGILQPWRTAAEIIDWSIPCPSIFERKRPLAENTMRRIARGIQKFVIDNPDPFIIKFQQNSIGQPLDEPIHTVMAGATRFGLVTPTMMAIGQTGGGDRISGVDEPMRTVVSKAEQCLIAPSLIRYNGEKSKREVRGQQLEDPIQTLDTSNRYGFVVPTLISCGYGERDGQLPRVPGIDKPLGTVVAGGGKHGLVAAFLAKHYGGSYTGAGSAADGPLHTVTAQDHNALVTSHILKMKGTNLGHMVTEPLQTITAGGMHFGEVRAFLLKYYGTGEGQKITDPLGTITTKDRFGQVTIHGEDYAIVDIGMRMLQPRELYNASSFPETYIIDHDIYGNIISKDEQVAKCGNAVPPAFAAALVRANLPELCVGGQNEFDFGISKL